MTRAAALLSLLVACGDSDATPDVADTSVAVDVEVEIEVNEPPHPATLTERGFQDVRVIVHLHSAFSHDACDEQGLDGEGKPNAACVGRLKAALCREHIGVAFMTDHPSNMRAQRFADLLYAGASDEVVKDLDQNPIAVKFACPTGQGGPDGKTTLYVGFEGTHTMGVGLARHLDPLTSYSVTFADETPTAELAALTAAVRAAGGFVTIAHSEEEDVSAATIAAHDVSAMELYNFHANFKVILGESLGDKLFELEPFVGDEPIPQADLTALVLLDSYPEPALDKWRTVSASRPITAFAGSDVHENVVLPALCESEGVCDGFVDFPNLKSILTTGGPVIQSDGERIDAYERIFRWVNNRVSIPGDASDVGAAVRAAFEGGKNVVVFEVLGDAQGTSVLAEEPDGSVVDMGGTVAAGATLWARTPDAPLPNHVATWTDGSEAIVEGVLWRTDGSGSHEVSRWTGAGAWKSVVASAPGSYHLEVLLTPLHLRDALGPAESMAEETYRWVETNAIRVD